MLHMILMLALAPISSMKTAQVRTCQWPHRCDSVAQVVHTCQWPHTCSEQPNFTLASVLPINGPCPAGRVCAAS